MMVSTHVCMWAIAMVGECELVSIQLHQETSSAHQRLVLLLLCGSLIVVVVAAAQHQSTDLQAELRGEVAGLAARLAAHEAKAELADKRALQEEEDHLQVWCVCVCCLVP